jgi:hypothetical protein
MHVHSHQLSYYSTGVKLIVSTIVLYECLIHYYIDMRLIMPFVGSRIEYLRSPMLIISFPPGKHVTTTRNRCKSFRAHALLFFGGWSNIIFCLLVTVVACRALICLTPITSIW